MEQIWPLPALWEAPNWWSGQHAREEGCNSEAGENVLIWTSWRSTTHTESCLWDWVTLCKNRVQAVLSRKQPYQKWAGVAQEEAEHELVVLHLAVGQSTHPGCARESVATRSRWLDLLSLEKEGSTEFLSLCLQLRDWGFKQYRFGFFSGILNGRVNRNELECDTLTKYKEFCIFLNHKAGQTLQLLTHRGCETSSFDVQGDKTLIPQSHQSCFEAISGGSFQPTLLCDLKVDNDCWCQCYAHEWEKSVVLCLYNYVS